MEKKRCSKCDEVKPLEEFNRDKNAPYGRGYRCKKCCNAYYEANKERARARALVCKFGITLEQYRTMLKEQCGKCRFCGKTAEENGKDLAVDHNHETGEVRWLLCNGCNSAIGHFQEDVAAMRKAADMLEKWQNL